MPGCHPSAIAAAASGVTDGLPDDEVNILAWTDRLLDNHSLDRSERERRACSSSRSRNWPTWS